MSSLSPPTDERDARPGVALVVSGGVEPPRLARCRRGGSPCRRLGMGTGRRRMGDRVGNPRQLGPPIRPGKKWNFRPAFAMRRARSRLRRRTGRQHSYCGFRLGVDDRKGGRRDRFHDLYRRDIGLRGCRRGVGNAGRRSNGRPGIGCGGNEIIGRIQTDADASWAICTSARDASARLSGALPHGVPKTPAIVNPTTAPRPKTGRNVRARRVVSPCDGMKVFLRLGCSLFTVPSAVNSPPRH